MKPEIKTTPNPKTPNKTLFSENQNSSNNILNIPTESDNYENFNNLILKSLKVEDENNFQENSSLLLENIITILENLSMALNDEKKLLYNILKEINTVINLIIDEFSSNSKKKIILNNNNTNSNFFLTEEKNYKKILEENIDNKNINKENILYEKLDTNSRVVFLLKIEKLNRKIASLNEELKTIKLIFNNSSYKLNNNKEDNLYKYFMKKLKDIKIRTKCDEFKYLLYIENQQKKIMDLEEQLKVKQNKSLSKEVLRSIRCFPNYVQYNPKEDINHKTLPLHEFLKAYKSNSHPKSGKIIKSYSTVKTRKQMHLLYNTINNSDRPISRNEEITLNDNIKTEINDIKNKKNNIINIKYFNNNTFYRNKDKNNLYDTNTLKLENLYDSENIQNEFKTINPGEQILKSNNFKRYIINKNLINKIKDFQPKTIITNKKEYFLAHPTINMAGVSKGKEAYIGLPKKLLKMQKIGNFKSSMIFPSSLSKTIVNIEKYRNKNILK